MLIVQEIIYADGVKVYDTVSLGSQWLSWADFAKKIIAGYDCDALTYNNSDKTIRDHFGNFVAKAFLKRARTKLDAAKKAKDDEFYTIYEDIEKEISEYDTNIFKDKVIYCCCDSEESNFVKYFKNNEDRLGIKKLLHTCYADGYDFRGEECRHYFEEANIVVTNPPFSLISEFIHTLLKFNVDFLFLGSNLTPKLKTIFPYFKDNVINVGVNSPNCFIRPDGSISNVATYWYTTFLPKVEKPFIHNQITYDESKYQKYIGTDIIDIPVYTAIPEDYDGIMGVPLTFLRYYNKNQFEILGKNLECIRGEDDIMNKNNVLYLLKEDGSKHEPFARVLIRRKKTCR